MDATQKLAKIHQDAPDCDALAMSLDGYLNKGDLPSQGGPEVFARIDADPGLSHTVHDWMEVVMTVSMHCRGNAAFDAVHARLHRP